VDTWVDTLICKGGERAACDSSRPSAWLTTWFSGGDSRRPDLFFAAAVDRPRWSTSKRWIHSEQHRERGLASNILRLGQVWGDTRYARFDELQAVYRVLKSCLLSGYGIQN
jgi:hypothetical protein